MKEVQNMPQVDVIPSTSNPRPTPGPSDDVICTGERPPKILELKRVNSDTPISELIGSLPPYISLRKGLCNSITITKIVKNEPPADDLPTNSGSPSTSWYTMPTESEISGTEMNLPAPLASATANDAPLPAGITVTSSNNTPQSDATPGPSGAQPHEDSAVKTFNIHAVGTQRTAAPTAKKRNILNETSTQCKEPIPGEELYAAGKRQRTSGILGKKVSLDAATKRRISQLLSSRDHKRKSLSSTPHCIRPIARPTTSDPNDQPGCSTSSDESSFVNQTSEEELAIPIVNVNNQKTRELLKNLGILYYYPLSNVLRKM